MDSPLVLLFAFFSWKWRKKLVQMMAVFGREGGLAKEMAGLLVDAQESGNGNAATSRLPAGSPNQRLTPLAKQPNCSSAAG